LLGCFLAVLGCLLWFLLCPFLGGELLPYLRSDGVRVHLVGGGGFLENDTRIATRGSLAGCLPPPSAARVRPHQHDEERLRAFFRYPIVALLADAVLPCKHLDAILIHDAYELLKDEKQVAFQEANGDGGAHSGENTEASRVGDGLFLALLVLLGLHMTWAGLFKFVMPNISNCRNAGRLVAVNRKRGRVPALQK
jgi:hypothetical protein